MFGIDVCTVSYLRRYYSYVLNFLRSGRADEGWFLMFGVQNAKYMAFGTPDKSALLSNYVILFLYFLSLIFYLILFLYFNKIRK